MSNYPGFDAVKFTASELIDAQRSASEGRILVNAWAVRAMLECAKPNVFKLFSAVWASGYTVNGIPAHD
jgi:hypothetical protein